jgi:hypothetical protein
MVSVRGSDADVVLVYISRRMESTLAWASVSVLG